MVHDPAVIHKDYTMSAGEKKTLDILYPEKETGGIREKCGQMIDVTGGK